MSAVWQRLRLEVIGPPDMPEGISSRFQWPITDRLIRETEENLTDLLPEGYSVQIREETPSE